MLRIIGLILMGAGAYAFWLDFDRSSDGPLRLSSLGQVWFDLNRESLIGLQSGIENRVSPEFWATIQPALNWPAAIILAGLGLGLLASGMILSIRAANTRARKI